MPPKHSTKSSANYASRRSNKGIDYSSEALVAAQSHISETEKEIEAMFSKINVLSQVETKINFDM
jgi:hypothetical protein